LQTEKNKMPPQNLPTAGEEEEGPEEEKGDGEAKKTTEQEDPDKIKPVVFIGLFILALFGLGKICLI
jgi:hypothetical protein